MRTAREWKLLVVLSREEVRRILREVRIPVYRACLATIYSCGLRLLEGSRLQWPMWTVPGCSCTFMAKSKKDRYVPLPAPTLALLRPHWRTHRSPLWLLPAPTRRGLAHSLAHDGGPVTRSSLQSAFRAALKRSGIAKRAQVHTLSTLNLRVIQENRGHRSPRTTALYTHLARAVRAQLTEPLNQLMADL